MKRRFEEKPAAPGDHDVPAAPVRPDFTPGVDVIHRVWNTPYVFGDLTFTSRKRYDEPAAGGGDGWEDEDD